MQRHRSLEQVNVDEAVMKTSAISISKSSCIWLVEDGREELFTSPRGIHHGEGPSYTSRLESMMTAGQTFPFMS